MTLEEVIKITLQKTFANEEPIEDPIIDIIGDEDYSLQCQNMIPAINEGLQILDKYQRNISSIIFDTNWFRENNSNSNIIDMKVKFENFKALEMKGVYLNDKQFNGYEIRSSKYLILPRIGENDVYTVFYREKPKIVTELTEENKLEEIKLDDELAALLPFYVASQVLKDENLTLSTIYRNEFEAGIAEIEESDAITPQIQTVYDMGCY